jgi:hypothetical protein
MRSSRIPRTGMQSGIRSNGDSAYAMTQVAIIWVAPQARAKVQSESEVN